MREAGVVGGGTWSRGGVLVGGSEVGVAAGGTCTSIGVLVGMKQAGVVVGGTRPVTGVWAGVTGVAATPVAGVLVGIREAGVVVGGTGVGSALPLHAMPIAKTSATHTQTNFIFMPGAPSDVVPKGWVCRACFKSLLSRVDP